MMYIKIKFYFFPDAAFIDSSVEGSIPDFFPSHGIKLFESFITY